MKNTISNLTHKWKKVLPVIIGFFALCWFLIRVIPKPSRATYPCQKAAFPLATAFVIWLIGVFTSIRLFQKSKALASAKKFKIAVGVSVGAICLLGLSFLVKPTLNAIANSPAFFESTDLIKDGENVLDALQSKVAISKSTKLDAKQVTYAELETMIREVVAGAGGLNDIITDGDVVVLKPNLVTYPKDKDKNIIKQVNGMVSEWRVVDIVAKLVKEINPNGKCVVMEGSVKVTTDVYRVMGYFDSITHVDEFFAFEDISGDWEDFESDSLISIELPDSLSRYPDELKPNKDRRLFMNKRYYDADVIISLPVLKNHGGAGITGAIKNVAIGCTPAKIYANKEDDQYLRNYGVQHKRENLSNFIHDYYVFRPVDFAITDGLQGMEYGPVGMGRYPNVLKNMRIMMASKDPVALDAVAGFIMQQDPQMVDYLVYLHNDGYGIADPALIEIVGDHTIPSLRTKFEHSRPTNHYSMFDKITINDYQIEASAKKDKLTLSVTNVDDDLSRITVMLNGGEVKRYVISDFADVDIDVSGIKDWSKDLELIIEDKYLNRKVVKPVL